MKKIFILVCSCALLAACNNSAKTNKSAGADSTSIEVTDIHNAEVSRNGVTSRRCQQYFLIRLE